FYWRPLVPLPRRAADRPHTRRREWSCRLCHRRRRSLRRSRLGRPRGQSRGPAATARGRRVSSLLCSELLAVTDELLVRQIDTLAVAFYDPANNLGTPAVASQNGERRTAIRFSDDDAKTDAHIEDLEHFCIADRPVLLD